MFPRQHDLVYLNTRPIWFAGIVTYVYGPCRLCPNDPEHNESLWGGGQGIMPRGPVYEVLIQANGYTYVAEVMEWDNGLGGWLILNFHNEYQQLREALEWTYYQGPPHLAYAPLEEALKVLGRTSKTSPVPPWDRVEGDKQEPVSVSDATGYTGA